MNQRKLSLLQKEYRSFFLGKMTLYGVKSPAELTVSDKSKFFSEVKKDWLTYKLSFQDNVIPDDVFSQVVNEPEEKYAVSVETVEKKDLDIKTSDGEVNEPIGAVRNNVASDKKSQGRDYENQLPIRQIIKSEPNEEQTDDLRILYQPNTHFEQGDDYHYPVVKMPKPNAILKLPRQGRSNQKGYKEDDFHKLLKQNLSDIEITNNVHMVIPNFNKPYEPDFVIYDKALNLYIDIEIDEPYDGYYRYPTHNYRAEDNFKQDNVRDLFFIESGWIVVRFTEKQIHCQPFDCIEFIRNVVNSVRSEISTSQPSISFEQQWDENQSIYWQLDKYREKYLGIPSFFLRNKQIEIIVEEQEIENVESKIKRTGFNDIALQFDKDLHKYFHKNDNTGNAEYISVTTLIERFFQFDILRYIKREAERQNKSEVEILIELQTNRDEAAVLGTELHLNIENYLTNKPYDDSLTEFKYFKIFINEKINPRGLIFHEAEKKIICQKYNVAGTVDCLFKNADGDFIMVDWKRSKKLIVNTTNKPDKRGFQIDIDGLRDITNSSYYRYCIQQNIYKYILETEYGFSISEMVLVVLHENYPKYHTIKLPVLIKETSLILNSINHKI